MNNKINFSLWYEIQKLGLLHSEIFPNRLVAILIKSVKLKACSFYLINNEESKLILKAQEGFDYDEYESFELEISTYPGRSFKKRIIVVETDLINSEEFRDKNLVKKYSLDRIVAIPFSKVNIKNEEELFYGAICLYPSIDFEEEINLEELQKCISLAYTYSIERTRAEIREKFVTSISKSNDLNSSLHRILHELKSQIGIEAGSVFLYNEQLRALILHASTGLIRKFAKRDVFFNKRDSSYATWISYINNRIISIDYKDQNNWDEKYHEKISNGKRAMLVIPISTYDNQKQIFKIKGVLRVVNKRLKHNSKFEYISFTKEDVDILIYVSSMLGIISHMFLNKNNRISYFEKIMHGTGSSILTSLQNLSHLKMHGKIEENLSKDFHFTINDTLDWLADIKNQMDRLENPHGLKLQISEIKVGKILMNAIRLFENSARANDIKNIDITNILNEGFFQLPMAKGNQRALMMVFRNLIENAIKYRVLDSNTCKLEISHNVDSGYLYIDFKDYGIGIPEGDERDIFDEGFRSENAMRQDPAGTGLGLTQSKDILNAMSGDLFLKKNKPTTITVKIKRY